MADTPTHSIGDLRVEYRLATLDEADASPDPIQQFQHWWDEALAAEVPEANAMTLATADRNGRPSARTVLLKGFDGKGFVFFTNYESRKGLELQANPQASLLFFWRELERQVRIDGTAERLAPAESDSYYDSRPLPSRVGAWASPQSRVIPDRDWLAQRSSHLEAQLGPLPARPPFWGGYRVTPSAIEFWQGRPSRLHDRLLYTRLPPTGWARHRLAP